jgi:cytochrome c-type biogenesis protein CcmH/NrfF
MGQVWKVTAKQSQGQISAGMTVEIFKRIGLIGPTNKEISNAIIEKYGITTTPSNFSIFQKEKM